MEKTEFLLTVDNNQGTLIIKGQPHDIAGGMIDAIINLNSQDQIKVLAILKLVVETATKRIKIINQARMS